MRTTSFFLQNTAIPLCTKPHHSCSSIWIYLITMLFRCRLAVPALLVCQGDLHAQNYETLSHLNGHRAAIYFSAGAGAKAERMGKQIDGVMAFYTKHLGFNPVVTLLVLSAKDWSTYTNFPFYGMPHYTSNKTLVVASEENDHWRSMVPDLDKMSEDLAQSFKAVYLDKNGVLTMEPFFDLLAIHELGHAYTNQGGLRMQRRWLGELFPNIMLHTYIAEKEPALLPALTVFPKMVVATTDRSVLKYTTLGELETNYNEIGPKYPQNYGWYQCRWHVSAGEIYDAGKIQVLINLWEALKAQREVLDDAELASMLKIKGAKSVSEVQLNWTHKD
jgi:hypothetical protein